MGRFVGFRDGSYTNEIGATLVLLRQFTPGYFTGMNVTQRGAGANMSVDVQIGSGLIAGTDRAFPVFIDTAAENVVITAANATNPRNDIIVSYVDLSVVVNNPATPNAPGALKLMAVAGTPAGTPLDPSDGTIQTAVGASNPWKKEARVLVDAAVGNIVTAKITDIRTLVSARSTTLQSIHPVGCIYTETTGVNPATTFGFGTWSAFGAGRVLVGKDSSGTFAVGGATGGEEAHVLTTPEMPSHTHSTAFSQGNNGAGSAGVLATQSVAATTSSTGDGLAHNNLQPYVVVYMWTRTA